MGEREMGRSAYRAGLGYDANPYSINALGRQAVEWATGWREERDEAADRRRRAFERTYERNAARRGQYDR